MNRTEKEQFVADFRSQVDASSVLYLADFSGLDVKSMTALRRQLRDSGAEFLVVKNRLAKLALEELDLPDLSDYLTGPTGFVLTSADAAAPAKAVSDFAKQHNDRPVFKVGVLDEKLLNSEQIGRIAKLPPKDQLLAELAGAFEAPMSAFVGALEALLREMAGLLEALKATKE
jgi:large subunit ribosomal protein L10